MKIKYVLIEVSSKKTHSGNIVDRGSDSLNRSAVASQYKKGASWKSDCSEGLAKSGYGQVLLNGNALTSKCRIDFN